MKPRTVIILILVVILVLASWAVASAQTNRTEDPFTYQVERGSAAGNGYQLDNQTWQVSGALSGGGYLLADPAASAASAAEAASPSAESGCCCTYLPCLTR